MAPSVTMRIRIAPPPPLREGGREGALGLKRPLGRRRSAAGPFLELGDSEERAVVCLKRLR
jgi:hypothetical protein